MRIGLFQAAIKWGDVEVNLDNFERRIEACPECDVIVLPEMFASGCMMVKQEKEKADREKAGTAARYGDIEKKMQEWAVRKNALVMGSTVCEENGKYYNRLIAAFPEGHCFYYDKRHCFRMGGENEHFTPGKDPLYFEYKGVKIAAFICYDLRFPVWCRNVTDYDLAVFVANWPESRRDVWQTLLKARAIENQAFVVGVNCVGEDNHGLKYAGDSVLFDARGNVVAGCREFEDEIVVATADIDGLHSFREKFAVLKDRDFFKLI